MKKRFIIKVAVASLIGVATIAIASYQVLHSPKYTLHKINSAIKEHDWKMFSEYVDVDAVYASLIDESTNSDNTLGDGIAKAMAGALKESAIAQIKRQVENPSDEANGRLFEAFSQSDSIHPRIEITKSGKVASVHIYGKYGPLDVPAFIDIQMRSEGMKYVVIGISRDNIESRTSLVRDAHKEFFIRPAQQAIEASVGIHFTKKYKGCANSFYGTCFEDLIMIERDITNKTQRGIASIEYSICPQNDDDACKFTEDKTIPAGKAMHFGQSQGWKFNQFIPEQKRILYTSLGDLIAKPTKIIFTDGDSIVVDEIEYLISEKQPTLKQLGEFMKKNELEFSDSVLAWSNE